MGLPKISVVIPSYNQSEYLEESITSILNQDYPNTEIVVVDGGSTDESIDIIKRYESYLSYWVSEKDKGQSDAIQKGFSRCTGDIFCWLCSDDIYKKGTFWIVAGSFLNSPDLDVLYGDTEYLYPNGETVVKERISYDYSTMLYAFNLIPQPSSFFSRTAYERSGRIDTSLNFAMDYDLFLRMGRNVKIKNTPFVLSQYRIHKKSKTSSQRKMFDDEWKKVREKILDRKLNISDKLKWYIYHVKVVWRFWAERGIVKISYDKKKYNL